MDLESAAAQTRQRARTECARSVAIWEEGINLLLQCMEPLRDAHYHKPDEDVELVQFALLAQAVNHEIAMHDLALNGYYLEAMGLVRPCIERWLAWWYVTNFPHHASRFVRLDGADTPEWGEMLRKLEQGKKDLDIRAWWNWLNQLAHVDKATLGLMWQPSGDKDKPLVRVGPLFNCELLEDCVGEAASVIPHLIEITDKLCERYSVRPFEPGAATRYHARLMEWMQELERMRTAGSS